MSVTRLSKFFEESVRDVSGKVSGKRLTALTATGLITVMVITGLAGGPTLPDAWWPLTALALGASGVSVFERRSR